MNFEDSPSSVATAPAQPERSFGPRGEIMRAAEPPYAGNANDSNWFALQRSARGSSVRSGVTTRARKPYKSPPNLRHFPGIKYEKCGFKTKVWASIRDLLLHLHRTRCYTDWSAHFLPPGNPTLLTKNCPQTIRNIVARERA